MAKVPLTTDSEFLVGEEKALVTVLGILFSGLFLYGAIDAILQGFKNLTYLNYLFVIALIPALLFFRKARSKHIYIRINKTGIYHDEKFVTGWPELLKAHITQKETTITIQDNFQLVLEYLKIGSDKGFRRKIPLTNTQNKSEEEIMEAIQFFWKQSK